jgi:hypothetical protein
VIGYLGQPSAENINLSGGSVDRKMLPFLGDTGRMESHMLPRPN